MQTTIGIYVTLVVIAVILYFLTKNTAQGAGSDGFWKWLKLGASQTKRDRKSDKPMVAGSPEDADVATVLEDIYKEFMGETEKIRAEFATALMESQEELKQEIIRLQLEIEALRNADRDTHSGGQVRQAAPQSEAGSPLCGVETAVGPANAGTDQTGARVASERLYFAILDELQSGKSPAEIAKSLGVSLNEVELVKAIMTSPASFAHADS